MWSQAAVEWLGQFGVGPVAVVLGALVGVDVCIAWMQRLGDVAS